MPVSLLLYAVLAVLAVAVVGGGGLLVWLLVRARLPVTSGASAGVTAPAVVIALRRTFNPLAGGTHHYARVGFVTGQGLRVAAEVYVSSIGFTPRLAPGGPPLRPGDRVWVRYDPVDPARAELGEPPGR